MWAARGRARVGARVEDVGLVARFVGDPPLCHVLAAQDEVTQRVAVDPLAVSKHAEAGQHPPRVADIRLLLRATVEATAGRLPLAQPPRQQVALTPLQRPRDRQRAHTGEHLPGVRLAAWQAAVAAVEVFARADKGDGGGYVERAHPPQQRRAAQRAVREARVNLAPFVAGEGAVLPLQTAHVSHDAVGVEARQRVKEAEDLDRAERVQHVRIVVHISAEASALVLARQDEVDDRGPVQIVEGTHQAQRRRRPV